MENGNSSTYQGNGEREMEELDVTLSLALGSTRPRASRPPSSSPPPLLPAELPMNPDPIQLEPPPTQPTVVRPSVYQEFFPLTSNPQPPPSQPPQPQQTHMAEIDHPAPASAAPLPLETHVPPINNPPTEEGHGPTRPSRGRRSQSQTQREPKSEFIPVAFPWATDRRASVKSMEELLSEGLNTIKGRVICKRCDKTYEMEYNLQKKFIEVSTFIIENKGTMHDRAPEVWMDPTLPDCKFCKQSNCVKPIIGKKKATNWLFLLLGQLLGCCRLDHLKYFCKHTKNHRTGAKDRVLYLSYLALCKQLDPWGPFDV